MWYKAIFSQTLKKIFAQESFLILINVEKKIQGYLMNS